MSSKSLDIDSVRRAGVSRRGGVRVRGGRLPPIRIRNVPVPTSNKKVFTPNIPQRRIQVKQETLEPVLEKRCYKDTKGNANSNGRGRGRGTKVYLQTGGSFLGEGPALKLKKEPQVPHYDKSSYTSSSRVKTEMQIKVDADKIDELLGFYDDKETFLDTDFKPVRLPFIKVDKTSKETKLEIKKDNSIEDVKVSIKQEPLSDDECNTPAVKYVPIKKEYDCDAEVPSFLTDLKLFQGGDDTLVLLQFPSCLPIDKACNSSNQEKSASNEKNSENEVATEGDFGAHLSHITDGHIGKLQVMKSGRMQITMGSVIMALEDGYSDTLLEAASISTENNKGDLIMLGKIGLKIVLRPVLKYLMEKELKQKNIC